MSAPAPSPSRGGVTVVANPVAGGFRLTAIDALVRRLEARGIQAEVAFTGHAGHLTEIAAALPPETGTLVVGGGDGSLNEAVTGLLRRAGEPPALGILPFGTANVLAHELKVPFKPEGTADLVASGRTRPLHLGRIGERPFLLMVSAGFDGDVVHAVDGATKKRWGKLAYAAAAIRLAVAQRGRDVVVDADGERVVCRLAVVTTARFYGGPLTITRQTDVTRPGLRLVTLADDRPMTLARAATALALGRLDRMPGVTDRPVTEVRFGGEGIAMQIDGDRLATTSEPVRAEPRVLRVLAG
jgi:diacylglycerol kinase (ATP)